VSAARFRDTESHTAGVGLTYANAGILSLSLAAEQRKSSLRIVVYLSPSIGTHVLYYKRGRLASGPALRCLLPPPPSSHRHGRRGAARARTRTPPTWSAARGQDRETRELLLLPSLRATDSCFQSSKKARPRAGAGSATFQVGASSRRRVGHGDAGGGGQHARSTSRAGRRPRPGWAGRAPSTRLSGSASVSFYAMQILPRHATKRIAPRRVASLSPRGV
jgi:hypothetical protein